jgi:hypothetical protein
VGRVIQSVGGFDAGMLLIEGKGKRQGGTERLGAAVAAWNATPVGERPEGAGRVGFAVAVS